MNSLTARLQRLKKFISRERQSGQSAYRVMFLRVPLRFLSRCRERSLAWGNDLLLTPLTNVPRLRAFQRDHAARLAHHFYVTVMPNTLHFLLPCLRLIPPEVSVVLLLNGTKAWEEEYLRTHWAKYPILTLRTFPGSSLSHGRIINLLLEANESNFGVIDHDLYVLDPSIFTKLTLNPEECAIGAFRVANPEAGVEFPTTHFLFLNVPLLKRIRQKYAVGAQVYTVIPRRVKSRLAALHLGYDNFLKPYLHYFDTMNVLFALALSEGCSFRMLDASEESITHIGGTSRLSRSLRANYVGLRFLEITQEPVIRQRYSPLYSPWTSSHHLRRNLPRTRSTLEFVAWAEKTIARIEQRMRNKEEEPAPGP